MLTGRIKYSARTFKALASRINTPELGTSKSRTYFEIACALTLASLLKSRKLRPLLLASAPQSLTLYSWPPPFLSSVYINTINKHICKPTNFSEGGFQVPEELFLY
jgi:hypothetical protein